ncbi:MAG: XRE family transcriptional regulator [Bacteroides sp.]|nr:XRE family transcriptional regulator [Bacteroides sp.]
MHIGKLIKQKLAEQGKTTLWLAQELSYNRTTMYKIYDKASLDTQMLLRISRIMKYDFFKDLSQELETALPSSSDCR